MTSFPLYAETYTIGNRVYRRGAYKKSTTSHTQRTGDTPDMYDDDVDLNRICDDEQTGNPENEDRESVHERSASSTAPTSKVCKSDPRISYNDGKYVAEIYVPVAFHGKLIGTRGTTRRELEESTESRITIPRKGQSGNIEIRSVIGVENVQRCIERIELLVADARKVAPVTHFVAVPCAKPEITQAFELFKESILNNERIPEESRNPELFTDLNKLHVTVCVLWLFDDEEIKKASDIINGCHAEIPNFVPPGSPFEVEIGGVTTWEDDPANVKVIFAEIHSEPLQRFCNLVRKRLVVAGFSPTMEKSLSTIESSVRMHMTLMKSGYADRQNPKSFDATVILDEYKDYHFGTIEVNKITVCSINTLDVETGFYQQCFEMSLL